MATLSLKNISKVYDNGFEAVHDFNLEIKDHEFIVLVGPSGCGKSTTLRMIAGLENITVGEFLINDKVMNHVHPKERDIAIVFQSYALYPHMDVYENMAFGLRLRNMDDDVIDVIVRNAAEVLGLSDYLTRKPRELSGGQRQRVALGRAITRKPLVFLMDEPLSNLDAQLRVQMRGEIVKIHRQLNTTTIYVTHDQVEAMTMADRIVCMKDGYVMQIGTPHELYSAPNNIFVAGFIGDPPMNFFEGHLDTSGIFHAGELKLPLTPEHCRLLKNHLNKTVIMGVRPEHIAVDEPKDGNYQVKSVVELVEMLGDFTNVYGNSGNQQVIARIPSRQIVKSGATVSFSFPPSAVHFFEAATEDAIR